MRDVLAEHAVATHGPPDGRPMLFLHGFGCDQSMWRHVWPAFADDHRVVLMDHVGVGGADPRAFDRDRHGSLEGYAADVLDVLAALDVRDVVLVGHSVSATIGLLAAAAAPERFRQLVLVGPSPRYIDTEGYSGGFSQADIDGLLESVASNYVSWSSSMAPAIIGNPDRPELGEELVESFCRADPEIAEHFARVTFLSDNRADLARVRTPAVVLQCADDLIAPEQVGRYVHERLEDSVLVQMEATGHCPNLSAPEETARVIREHLR